MSFSIGAGGSGGAMGGPRGMMENMATKEAGRALDPRVMARLLAYLRPHWRLMLVALFLTLVTTGLTLLTPYLIAVAIDQYIAAGDLQGLTRTAVAIAAAFVGIFGATAGQIYILSWVGQRVLATMRTNLFDHLQRLSLGYHETHITGVTVSRVINDVGVINELLSQGVVTLIGDSLLLIGIVVVMVSMSPQLALLAFTVLPLMLIATVVFARMAQGAFRNTRARDCGGGGQPGRRYRRHARDPGFCPGGCIARPFCRSEPSEP